MGNKIAAFGHHCGYHCLTPDLDNVAARFAERAPVLMDQLLDGIDDLAGELAVAIFENDGPYIAAVGELSWLIAHGEYCYAACQLSARRKRYVLAQPSLTYFRNLDTRPLPMRVLRFEGSFEVSRGLPLDQARRRVLLPGASFLLNGFEELVWFEESGIALASVSTLPLGAYEATFDAATGERIGLFATEMRLSSIEVVLRTLAAVGYDCAIDIAHAASNHAVREMRWSALNYVWRCNPSDMVDRLLAFTRDPDPQIADIARQCLTELEAEAAA